MKEAVLHLVDGKPDDIHIDGKDPIRIEAFVLLTKTRGESFGHILVFGGGEAAGRMLVNAFTWAVSQDPQMAYTIARAAEDILDIEHAARSGPPPPEGGFRDN